MKVGERTSARVEDVRDNGVYLRAGERQGIIPVVELTWDETRSHRPTDFAKPGDELEFIVMTMYEDGFSGSLKRLEPTGDPRAHPGLKDGRWLDATVRALKPFGVFVDLAIGVVAKLEPCSDEMRNKLKVGSPLRVSVTDVSEETGNIIARSVA